MKKPGIFGNSGLFIAQPGENGENSHCSVGNPNPRILSQPIGSELHSVESRPYRLRPEGESRHFDSPGHCKSMLPGFAFPAGFPLFSGLQPRGLQQVAKALVWQAEKITSGNFRIFPAFSALKMSTLIFLVTIPDRWTICFSFVKIITEKSNG